MKADRHKLQEEHLAVGKLIHTLKEINFNRSWKNVENGTCTPKTLTLQTTPPNRLMTERNLHDLFQQSKEKPKSNRQEKTTPIKQGRNGNKFSHMQFLKPYNEYDKLLTGMPFQSQDTENLRETNPSSDLTAKFKKDYIIGKVIGEGPYAQVRVAYHRRNSKKVAIKIYLKTKLIQIGRKKTVKRQIKILQAISHPNIVRLIDVAQTNNHLSLIMQYLPGISLASALKQQSSQVFPQTQCRLIIKQLARALMYLHSLLIAHRDIKLQNIILDEFSQPKLIDFGFSTCIKEGTKINIFCGTPTYMAPQIVQRREYRGQNADIWALGVIMFIMLVGYFPFQGSTDDQLYSRIIKADYPTKDIKGLPTAHDLIRKIFTVNPDKRITAFQILEHPWIKNEQRQQRQANKFELNSTIKSKRIEDTSIDKSCPKQSYRESYSQKKRRFEIDRLKELSSTQRGLNHSYNLIKKTNKRDKSIDSKNSFIMKENQNSRRQTTQRDKNMKILNFLKVQFQKCDKQKTTTISHRL